MITKLTVMIIFNIVAKDDVKQIGKKQLFTIYSKEYSKEYTYLMSDLTIIGISKDKGNSWMLTTKRYSATISKHIAYWCGKHNVIFITDLHNHVPLKYHPLLTRYKV